VHDIARSCRRRHPRARQRHVQDLVRAKLPHPVANTLLLDNALATMGAGLPSAIMAAMLYPERRVMAVCGDGGFMMNSQELETAVRLKLNLVVLVIEDHAFGMIRWKQAVDHFPISA
jgi:acetolactate synthase-1/2/3 large subunit